MPDASAPHGVNVAASLSRLRMLPEQAAAHARMAALPTQRHSRTERDIAASRTAAAELAERLRRTRLNSGAAYNAAPDQFGQRRTRSGAVVGAAQRLLILAALRAGPLTADEISARFAATRPSARIGDLRDLGHDIATERVEQDGRVTYRYRLLKEARG